MEGGRAVAGINRRKSGGGTGREGGRIAQVTSHLSPGPMIVEAIERVAWKAALCFSDL
jgi:hypothetical protein